MRVQNNQILQVIKIVITISLSLTLVACKETLFAVLGLYLISQGGSDQDEVQVPPEPEEIIYEGSELPAKITTDNAVRIISNILNRLATYTDSSIMINRAIVAQTDCSSGSLDQQDGLIVFTNCQLNSVTHHHQTSFFIESEDPQHTIVDLELAALTHYEQKNARDIYALDQITIHSLSTGSMRQSTSLIGNSRETKVAMNLSIKDHENDKFQKFSDFNVVFSIDDINDPDSKTAMTISGSPARYYDSVRGYVQVSTTSALYPADDSYNRYAIGPLTSFAENQGELSITGDSSSLLFTPAIPNHFRLQVDEDGDGVMDWERTISYKALENTQYENGTYYKEDETEWQVPSEL